MLLGAALAVSGVLGGLTASGRPGVISETEPLAPPPFAVLDSLDGAPARTLPSTSAPAADDPAVMGQWHGLIEWPAVPVHSIVLHTGKVLWFRGDGPSPHSYLWDPITNALESQPNFDNIFCAGHSQLADGKILVTGGALEGTSNGPNYTHIFDPVTKEWSRGPDMRNGRYYPTQTVLGDGRTGIFAGTDPFGNRNLQVEIYRRGAGPDGTDVIDHLQGADRDYDNYPRNHLLPNGKIVHVGPDKYTDLLDPATGTWTVLPRVQYGHRGHGSSVMLPPGFTKIMVLGGYTSGSGEDVTTATAEIIDMSASAPKWTYTTPMNYRRSHQNAVILPDGKVLVAGGTLMDDLEMPVLPGEIYDPATATWTVVASMHTHRLYHSSAVLLPDGRCLWAGTNSNKTGEIYSPPYLFKGPRPVIDTAPASVAYGAAFSVGTQQASSIASVVFMRPGANTHSQDMDQRYIPLAFSQSGDSLSLTAPSNPNIAPPGYYMLFILNGQGIPSVSKFVRLGGTSSGTGTNQAPIVVTGANQTITLPAQVLLNGSVSDDGLPSTASLSTSWSKVGGPGTVIFGNSAAPSTSASFSAAGSYVLRLTANDGALIASATLTITVNPSGPGGGSGGAGGGSGAAGVIDARVEVRSDDAEEKPVGGAVNLSSSDLELVYDGVDQAVGVRFPNLAIPPGATISNAYIQFTADQAQAPAASLTVQGHLDDNAPTFTTAAADITSRPRTLASSSWSPAPWAAIGDASLAQRSPDLSSIVQEIVNRPGWARGNALAFILTGTGKRVAVSFDGLASSGPLLHVEFGTAAPSNLAPSVEAGPDQTVTLPSATSLLGIVTDDGLPAPSALAVSWAKVSGPGTASFATASVVSTTAAFSDPGSYVLRLSASDGALTTTDTLTITVNPPSTGGGAGGGTASGVVEVRVASEPDDAEERPVGGPVYPSGSDLELINDTTDQAVGIRFAGLAIPQGATITAAWVQFTGIGPHSSPVTLRLDGQLTDNALPFVATAGDVSTRPRTAASVDWSPASWISAGDSGPAQRTQDLSTIVQEIVNRPGWTSGNALAFIVTGSGRRTAWSFDGSSVQAPLLHVEFGSATSPPNQAPVVEAGPDQTINVPATATLNGAVTDDGLPSPPSMTLSWTKLSGPGTVTFSNAAATTATASFSVAGAYVLRLTASDGVASGSDTLTVTVSDADSEPSAIDVRVSAGTDDAEEKVATGAVSTSSSDLELVYDGRNQLVGMRFVSLAVPRGAQITRASIQFTTDQAHADPRRDRRRQRARPFRSGDGVSSTDSATALTVKAQSADNPLAFTTVAKDISMRPTTVGSVAWTPATWPTAGEAGPAQQTPDLSALVQEIVDRPGWASGQAMVFIISGTGRRTAASYDGSPAGAPLLHLEFNAPTSIP